MFPRPTQPLRLLVGILVAVDDKRQRLCRHLFIRRADAQGQADRCFEIDKHLIALVVSLLYGFRLFRFQISLVNQIFFLEQSMIRIPKHSEKRLRCYQIIYSIDVHIIELKMFSVLKTACRKTLNLFHNDIN
ncbi:hypothetical protein Barb6_01079 [Bacteroidales bacterium Barb6]|nr:hypothetical protein Barb6_01079 [Bacteroidales bacterium Barb6]